MSRTSRSTRVGRFRTPRRAVLRLAAAGALALTIGAASLFATASPARAGEITVYKSATCICCEKWIDHVQAAGFRVIEHDVPNVATVKQEHGVPDALMSCHTSVIDGYVLEGHVPADLVQRVLAERPDVAGLAVPGMPAGSPGMEGAASTSYEVLAFRRTGAVTTYAVR